MSGINRQTTDFSDESAPNTGGFLDVKTRSVQQMNGSKNCLGTNLPETGATILGIEKSDDIDIVIFENGIWIPKDD